MRCEALEIRDRVGESEACAERQQMWYGRFTQDREV